MLGSRKTGSIIALIDQPDNSITIYVIQIVFNFPQRYLYFPIYISFIQNYLAYRNTLTFALLSHPRLTNLPAFFSRFNDNRRVISSFLVI